MSLIAFPSPPKNLIRILFPFLSYSGSDVLGFPRSGRLDRATARSRTRSFQAANHILRPTAARSLPHLLFFGLSSLSLTRFCSAPTEDHGGVARDHSGSPRQ